MKSGVGDILSGGRLFGPEMREDPFAVYDELRANDPVHRDDTIGAWVLTRHDDVSHVLNDPRFSSNRVARARGRFDDEFGPLFAVLGTRMSEYDGEDHKRVRALVHDAFIRTAVEEWEPFVRERIDELLDAAVADGGMEFMADFAVPLPLAVILELVGIPPEDRNRVKSWSDDFSNVALNYFAGLPPEELRSGREGVLAFRQYLVERIAEVERSPRKDLLSSLVKVEHEGARLTLDELLANSLLLLAAGNETTTCLLGNGLAALLQHPDQLELLRNDRSLLPNAIEEFLRYDAPVQFLGRIAEEEVELRCRTIAKGDTVVAVIAAANRDPKFYDRPAELDVTRPHVTHLAFGHGHHFCAGAQLARMEARLAFESLLDCFGRLELDPARPLRHRENLNVRCFDELHVRVG